MSSVISESVQRIANSKISPPLSAIISRQILFFLSGSSTIMRIDYYICGTLVTTATSLSAPILDTSPEQGPDALAQAIDRTASTLKREEPVPRSQDTDLAKKAFIKCPELSGLPSMACSTDICGGQSRQRPGYCNDNYPSVRECKCLSLPPSLTFLKQFLFLLLLSDR